MTEKAKKQDCHNPCMGFLNAGLPRPGWERSCVATCTIPIFKMRMHCCITAFVDQY